MTLYKEPKLKSNRKSSAQSTSGLKHFKGPVEDFRHAQEQLCINSLFCIFI